MYPCTGKAGEMALWVKVLDAKPDALSLTFGYTR